MIRKSLEKDTDLFRYRHNQGEKISEPEKLEHASKINIYRELIQIFTFSQIFTEIPAMKEYGGLTGDTKINAKCIDHIFKLNKRFSAENPESELDQELGKALEEKDSLKDAIDKLKKKAFDINGKQKQKAFDKKPNQNQPKN